MDIKYPLQFNSKGRTASSGSTNEHIRDMIEQVLFTTPGERINRPNFGSGLLQLVFQPISTELTTTTQFLVQGALQQWLGDLIDVNDVKVDVNDSTIQVNIMYTVIRTGEKIVSSFSTQV